MTDTQVLYQLQEDAVQVLMDETFEHVEREMNEQYQALGKRNAQLNYATETKFMYAGTLYPTGGARSTAYGKRIPILHYSLLNELETINKSLTQDDFHYIKNFFIAAVSQSHNAIVLDALLPVVLVNALKAKLSWTRFKVLDTGVYGGLQQEPISVTRQNIQNLQEHYKSVIARVQCMLMDKLLLQK
jgi:hypothetical protein